MFIANLVYLFSLKSDHIKQINYNSSLSFYAVRQNKKNERKKTLNLNSKEIVLKSFTHKVKD
jgi:hypothetical protein